jgi:hypothetical protein
MFQLIKDFNATMGHTMFIYAPKFLGFSMLLKKNLVLRFNFLFKKGSRYDKGSLKLVSISFCNTLWLLHAKRSQINLYKVRQKANRLPSTILKNFISWGCSFRSNQPKKVYRTNNTMSAAFLVSVLTNRACKVAC